MVTLKQKKWIQLAQNCSQITYSPNCACAAAYSEKQMLDIWLYTYLICDANAEVIADELMSISPVFLGPVLLPVSSFTRCCGPEEGMRYFEERERFELRVHQLMEVIAAKADLPPLLLHYCNGEFDLYDGAHRYEAYSRLGISQIPVIIWTRNQVDGADFRSLYFPQDVGNI